MVVHRRLLGPFTVQRRTGKVCGMQSLAYGDSCTWRIRDRESWRAGVLFTASADVLVAWHAVEADVDPLIWADIDRRCTDAVEWVRQARLAGDLDELEAACRELLDRAGSRVPSARMRAVLGRLGAELAALAADVAPCLLGCDTCPHPDQVALLTGERG